LSLVHIAKIEARLKPCPFCGGEGRLTNTWTASYSVQCEQEDCEAEIHGLAAEDSDSMAYADHDYSARSAASRWNRRAA
jgi:hypothetical protein